MKTLFINPDARLYRNVPLLALAYVATHFGVKVIDQNTKPEPKDRFLDQKTDVLGIFVRSVSYTESQRIAAVYKAKYPKAKIKSIYTPINVQCCYPTIQFKEQIRFTKPFGDSYPFPDFSLFDSFDVWLSHWQKDLWPYGILTSVGCPFQCTYCAARNRGWRTRSPKNCVEELKQAKREYKILSFEVLDDAFNVDKKRVLEFCQLVKPLKLRWICANGLRADLFDEEQAKAMASSGCDSVAFGVESVDPQVLQNVKKGETIEQIAKAVDIAEKYFKNINGFFILGLPGSSYEKDLRSVEWLVKKRIMGIFSYYVPLDKQMEYDDMFYGVQAIPQSDEYPKHLQKRIYKMVEFMQGPTTISNFLPRVIKTLSLVWQFDRKNFPSHIIDNFKRFL
ncbi:MAG: B12-binding domain-containing radical SAM protein [Patescibacteria group bacterium]